MRRYRNRKNMVFTIMVIVILPLFIVSTAQASVRIKDITYFQGVRDNQLIGYGLVVGLNGTGDRSQSVFTVKSIASLLYRLGIEVDAGQITPKNLAAVMVTATLPPFIKSGARIDVTLSSLGDAQSLQGGTLLLTPLQGADGKVYAVAQGQVSVGGFEAGARGRGDTFGTVARIPQGALIEQEVPVTLVTENNIKLSLKKVDFTTCIRVAEAINVSFNQEIAEALDGATVSIRIPDVFRNNLVKFLAHIELIEVKPDNPAKIVINERTGTIVGGKDVKISNVSITHKNINIDIKPAPETAEADAEKRETGISPHLTFQEAIFTEGEDDAMVISEAEETTIGEVAQLLHSMGVKPPDMIAIFQAIKQTGAIQAELEII